MGHAEGAEIVQIWDFMVDFRLNNAGDLELAEFGERCRDAIREKAYPRLLEALSIAPVTPSGGTTAEGKALVCKAVEEERTRPLKSTHFTQPATEAARTLQKELGASAAYANQAVEEIATNIIDKAPGSGRKQQLHMRP